MPEKFILQNNAKTKGQTLGIEPFYCSDMRCCNGALPSICASSVKEITCFLLQNIKLLDNIKGRLLMYTDIFNKGMWKTTFLLWILWLVQTFLHLKSIVSVYNITIS